MKTPKVDRQAVRFRCVAASCGAVVAGFGLLGSVSWYFGVRVLSGFNTSYIHMAPSTACSFLVLGAMLTYQACRRLSAPVRAVAVAAALLVAAFGLLSFIELFTSMELYFEDFLFPATEKLGAVPSNRMSPFTGLILFLAGTDLLLILWRKDPAVSRHPAGFAGCVVTIIGAVGTMGYIFGTPLFYGGAVDPMASTTVIAFLFAGVGLVAGAGPDAYPLRMLTGPSTKARLLRAFLPMTAAIIMAQSLLHRFAPNLFPNYALGAAVMTLIFSLITGVIVVVVGRAMGQAMDLAQTERQEAEAALQENEERFQLTQRAADAGTWDWNLVTQELEWSDKNFTIFGLSPENGSHSIEMWHRYLHPQDREMVLDLMAQAIEEKDDLNFDYRIIRVDGAVRWLNSKGKIFRDDTGRPVRMIGINLDITDRKQADERFKRTSRSLRALSACNQALVRATQEKEFLTDVCEVIVRECGYPLACVGYAQSDQMKSVVLIASAGVGAGHPEWIAQTWGDGERGQSLGGMAIKTGEIQVARDILQDPAIAPWHEEWIFKAIIALPLIVEGKTIGILDICAKDPAAFDPEEVRLLEELAGGISFGIWVLCTDQERQRAESEVKHSLIKIEKFLDGAVLAVAKTVEVRDPYTADHQRQVGQLAAAIAQKMGFPEERVEGMRTLGCLHDIGKIAIPIEILSKPGRITYMEFALIKDHPRVGYEIIKDIDFPFPLAEGILQHHERLDGSGYPQGIKGPDIILEARILAVADVVEAVASHRPYRKALGINQAMEVISRSRGILYDPEVVDVCLRLFTEKEFKFEQ